MHTQPGRTDFAELMTHVSPRKFQTCVSRLDGDDTFWRCSCWDQYLCMLFAQLTYRKSLRDIEVCLRAVQSKLYHVGIRARRALDLGGCQRDTRLAPRRRLRAGLHGHSRLSEGVSRLSASNSTRSPPATNCSYLTYSMTGHY